MCLYSLFKDVLRVHPSVILGQFDGEDDAGDQKDTAASQTEPERVLEKIYRNFITFFYRKTFEQGWLISPQNKPLGYIIKHSIDQNILKSPQKN